MPEELKREWLMRWVVSCGDLRAAVQLLRAERYGLTVAPAKAGAQ